VDHVTLVPSLRIQRHTAPQRRHLRRALEAAEELAAHARSADQAWLGASLDRRLRGLAASLSRSPYYLDAFRRSGLSPRDLRAVGDLAQFPTLDRPTLQSRWAELPAFDPEAVEARELVTVASSGSTGDPVTVVKDGYDCLHMWAVLRFWTAWAGVRLPARPRVALLCSLASGLEYSVRLPLLADGALHRVSLARPRARERLRRARPSVLFSDPAGLHWLAGQPDPPPIRIVLTSAQHFSPAQRREARRAFVAPVINYYATTETGPLAWECLDTAGRFHVLLPDVWVESLEGEIVVTRLRPSVLPLLRYRTGDRGRVLRDDCACGYRGFSIAGFTGRRACLFLRPDGTPTDAWQLAWLFKHYPLTGFRLTQRGPERFDLEIASVQDHFEAEDLRARLGAALRGQGWERPAIALRVGPGIETRGEKPEPFRRLGGDQASPCGFPIVARMPPST
jgi:phenylacetate-CoA ligase